MIPSPEQERDLRAAGWRKMPLAAEIVFFVLTIWAIQALYFFCVLLHLPKGWIALVASIATAEVLIRRLRFWRTGVESALWIGGLIAFIFSLPSSGEPEAILVFVAAFAIAGWRLRNAIFGTIAVVLVIAYLAVRHSEDPAMLAGVAIGILASFACARVWRRPSNEFLAGAIAIAAPIAGFIAFAIREWRSQWEVVLLFIIAAAVNAAIGVRYRILAPLVAAVGCVAVAGVAAHDFVDLAVEWQLVVYGLTTLAFPSIVMRALRDRTTGIVVTKRKESEAVELMQMAAMMPLAAPAVAADTGMKTGGGEFGGGGASSDY